MKDKDTLNKTEMIRKYIKKNTEVNVSDVLSEFLISFSELFPILCELYDDNYIFQAGDFSYKYNFCNIHEKAKTKDKEEKEVEKSIDPLDDLLNLDSDDYKKKEDFSIYIIGKSSEVNYDDPKFLSKIMLIADDPRQVVMELEQCKGFPIKVCDGVVISDVDWSIKQLKSLGLVCCARLGREFFSMNYNDDDDFKRCCIKCMEEILMLGKEQTLDEARNISTLLYNISLYSKQEKAIKVYTKIKEDFNDATSEDFCKAKDAFYAKEK